MIKPDGRKKPMSDEHKEKIRKQLAGRKHSFEAGRPRNTPEILWSKVEMRGEDECWPWVGYRNKQGYGRTWIDDKGYYAHRVIFNLANPNVIELSAQKNKIDFGLIMHTCDNPCCCNPKHLVVGNHMDNMVDKKNKGRCPDFKGEKSARSKLTAKDILDIVWISSKGISSGEIAKLFNIHKSTVKTAISGKHYSEVDRSAVCHA